ncbi:hypothetical protein ACSBOB_04655 [Mesorhizobium sp. ASY16-5R]|uniref:hypothetical protein n=1 Tax=Mesorhizobium sp. ASY16-5R TaxID=3445772 RepID=UPI003F9F47DA
MDLKLAIGPHAGHGEIWLRVLKPPAILLAETPLLHLEILPSPLLFDDGQRYSKTLVQEFVLLTLLQGDCMAFAAAEQRRNHDHQCRGRLA